MRTRYKSSTCAWILFIVVTGSCTNSTIPEAKAIAETQYPLFTIGVQRKALSKSLPGLQTFAWARRGNQVLLIGGRIEGFHGINQSDTVFKTSKANTSVWVIDLSDFSYDSLPLNPSDTGILQLLSANMEFCQDGDLLYLAGGYGIQKPGAAQSNYTFNNITAISVSGMINQVLSGAGGDPHKAIISKATSPFLQVAGGELLKVKDTFYLLFGQNYQGAYQISKTGQYTSAVRKFRLQEGQVVDTSSYIDPVLHRRDLPFAPVVQQAGNFYAAFGGVFTSNNNGFQHPVYISFNKGVVAARADTLTQMTNQYDCALASFFDAVNNVSTTVLFGGIGRYQYNADTGKWEDGDNGAKLPFVRSVTQMIFQNGSMSQFIQTPPQPQLPALFGANAVFFPDTALLYANRIIDYRKLTKDTTSIGFIYGGIQSQKPTSSNIYPTSINNTLYEVFVYKNQIR